MNGRLILYLVLFLILWHSPVLAMAEKDQPVDMLTIKGPIIPIVATYVDRGIDEAQHDGAICVIQMDTPGGLDSSMRNIVQKILNSSVPVVVYVYPEGARAASAGVYIAYSAHIIAMAPGTNIGAAHPVAIDTMKGETKENKIMNEKATNDAVAYIRSLAEKRKRSAKWAEDSVRNSVSITAKKALELGVIDLIADNPESLRKALKEKEVRMATGKVVLDPSPNAPKYIGMTSVERFLFTISDPNIALILMMLGLYGLIYEFMTPGAILPGVVGGICFILALYSLGTLPINYAGLFLIILSVLLFLAEIKAPTHGMLTVGGIISLVLGAVMLIPSGYPYLAISRSVIFGVTFLTTFFFVFIVSMVVSSLRRKAVTGKEEIVGAVGVARTDLAPEGMVFVLGEIWKAVGSGDRIRRGEKVRVREVDGLTLVVEKKENK